jgi:hypothetical protein
MLLLKIILISGCALSSFQAYSHLTVFGFESSLNNQDKLRLDQFIQTQQKKGYRKCYYDSYRKTVVCENSSQQLVYFK